MLKGICRMQSFQRFCWCLFLTLLCFSLNCSFPFFLSKVSGLCLILSWVQNISSSILSRVFAECTSVSGYLQHRKFSFLPQGSREFFRVQQSRLTSAVFLNLEFVAPGSSGCRVSIEKSPVIIVVFLLKLYLFLMLFCMYWILTVVCRRMFLSWSCLVSVLCAVCSCFH